jgi:hypothetical protein
VLDREHAVINLAQIAGSAGWQPKHSIHEIAGLGRRRR